MLNVSEWEIFIDDVEGELAMDKREDTGGRMIDVLAKEEIMPRVYAAEKLIELIAMYGRIGHDKPKDYRELCQDYLKEYLPNSKEVMK